MSNKPQAEIVCELTKEWHDKASAGRKPSKAWLTIGKMLEQAPLLLTQEQVRKLQLAILNEADPEERRELLSESETCPCCGRWMGHNR
jgi:hypothetical protein